MFIYSRAGFTPRHRNRARGLAGAECSGAMQAVVTGQSAQGLAGAECRGSLISYAKGYAGAEAGGAPAIKALGFAGAEAGGTLEPATPAYPNGYKNYFEFMIPAASIKAAGILNYLACIDETFPELRTVANGGLVEHASGFDKQLELADGTVLPFARLTWDAATGRIVLRARFATLPQADTRVRLFFGKTVSTDGANEGGAYAAHLMAPNIRTGADRIGLGRGWTTASTGLSPFVHRYPLRIETAAPGDIITPGSFSVLDINNYTIPAGKILDCRGLRARHHDPSQGKNIASFRLNMGNNSTFTGGTSYTTNDDYLAMAWGESHGHPTWDNPPGIRIDSAPAGGKVYIEGVDLRDNMDAIIPASSIDNTAELYFNAVRIPGCADDPWQNDAGRLVKEILNSLIVGHTTLSERPGRAAGNTIKYRHCLIWKKRRRWDGDEKWHNGQYDEPGANPGYAGSRKVGPWNTPTDQNNANVTNLKSTDGWGHQGLWKFGGGDTIVDMEDCLIRVDTIPVDGPTDFFLPNIRHVMNRVTLLWMQGGTCPLTPIPPGVTVLTDTNQCFDVWNQAYADFHNVNGFNPATDDLDWTRAP